MKHRLDKEGRGDDGDIDDTIHVRLQRNYNTSDINTKVCGRGLCSLGVVFHVLSLAPYFQLKWKQTTFASKYFKILLLLVPLSQLNFLLPQSSDYQNELSHSFSL